MTSARYSVSIESVAVGMSVAESGVVNYGDFEKGMILVPSGEVFTELTVNASVKEEGDFLMLPTVAIAVAGGNAYPIPDELKGARFFKITGDGAGSVGVTLKD